MTSEQVDKALNIGTDECLEVRWYGSYSARGMFGEFTEAIVVDNEDYDELMELLEKHEIPCRSDGMGKGSLVIY